MGLVLGVDPGLTRCGIAIIESESSKLVFTAVLKSDPKTHLSERVGGLAVQIDSLLESYSISAIALERVFAQANLKSVMGVAQISGAIMASAYRQRLLVEFFTPTEVKLSVCGNGRASKVEVIGAISRFYPGALQTNHADEADAVAIALCATRRGSANRTPAQRAWLDANKDARGRLG